MVETPTALVRITREPPCDGRREALLERVTRDREGRSPAAIERHLSGCPRCRAFVESIAIEQRLAGEAFAHWQRSADSSASPVPDTFRDFERWLDRELSWRDERELATTLTHAAQWLHQLDPEIDKWNLWVSGRRGNVQPRRDVISRGLSSLLARRPQRDLALEECVQKWVRHGSRQFPARIDLARVLLRHAKDIVRDPLPLTLIREALIEWYSGASASVPELLEQALERGHDPDVRAACLLDYAVWHADEGKYGLPMRLIQQGLVIGPGHAIRAQLRWVRIGWATAVGDVEQVRIDLGFVKRDGMLDQLRERTSPALLRRKLDHAVERFGADRAKTEKAYRILGAALYET